MSRNGSGIYSVPNTFVAGTAITASGHNQNWSDAATEITNSVAADGQTSMTGSLKASLGSLALPSYTFAADTDTGRYRKSSNTMADVVGGVEIVEIASTGMSVTGDVSASGVVKQGGFAARPIGEVTGFAGSSAPTGWLLCYGQAVSRTTYAALFAVIATTYGAGDGSTTFNVPDLRGRTVAGLDNMGGVSADRLAPGGALAAVRHTLGGAGGESAHTLTAAELPTITSTNVSQSISTSPPLGQSVAAIASGNVINSLQVTNSGSGSNWVPFAGTNGWGAQNTFTANNSISVTSTGTSGSSHNNIQPTILLNQIIFAGV